MNQRLLGWIFALVIFALVLTSIMCGDFATAGVGIGLFFLAPMVARPDLLWIAAIITLGSGITLGLRGGAGLHQVSMLGFVVFVLIKLSISSHRAVTPSVPRKACIALILVAVFTATMRGWGLKMLDSSLWGGMQYVSLIAALLFYIYSSHVTISHIQLKRMLLWFFIFSLLPAGVSLIVLFFPAATWLGNFVEVGALAEQEWQATADTRIAFMQYPAIWIGVFGLFLYDRHSKITPMVVVASALSFVMLGLSGHRTVVVLLGLTVLVYMVVRQRTSSLSQFMKLAGILILLLVALYCFVGRLPSNFQRPFAALPGIVIADEAGKSASLTSQWRIALWKNLLAMAPDYLWVGRGLAYSAIDANATVALASDSATRHVYFAAIHLYHNGPLWLVLDLGLAGLVTGLVFMLSGIVRYGRALRRIPSDARWQTAYVVFYSLFTGNCIFFFAVIGSVKILCHILALASILEVILRSSEAEDRSRELASEIGDRKLADNYDG